jgi:hypothetical protein
MTRRPFPPDALHHLITTTGRDITARRHTHGPRRHRSYPRVVKRMRHNSYRVKQPHDHGTRHTGPPTINPALHHHKINLR